jgi:death-on-curing family protein
LRYDNGDSLGATGTHPLYSLDRQQFIPTEDIKVGERLLSKSGIITVVSKRYDATPQAVYNLEVGQWHNFLVGKSGVVVHNGPCGIEFLNDAAEASKFADEIININKATEGGGILLSGSPSSAINTALYYSTVPEQGASIFRTIIKNHMFTDGNKRTAVNTFLSFCKKADLKVILKDNELMTIANKVATNELDDVLEISIQLLKK